MLMNKSPKKLAVKKRNEKGEITNWDGAWPEALLLKQLVKSGIVTEQGMGAGTLKKKYPDFAQFNTSTLNGGLQSIKNAYNKAIQDRKKAAGEGSKF
jgi:hypothetical protein